MSRRFNRKSVIVAAVVALIASAGAYAYWTQLGQGDGTAATGSGVAVTVNQTSTPTNLSPGSTPQALSGTFTNLNSGGVYVGTITATLTSITNGAGGAGPEDDCTIADYAIASPIITHNTEIISGTGVGSWSGPTIAMLNRVGVNQDACKGATVNIHYAIS